MEGMIRLTVPDDAPALLTLQQRLDHQSHDGQQRSLDPPLGQQLAPVLA